MTNSKEMSKVKHKLLKKTVLNGIFGGVFIGVFFFVMHYFNMTEVKPKLFLNLIFSDSKWIERWYAYLILLVIFSIMSTILALVYYYLLRQRKSWVVGAVYGGIIWGVLYYISPILINNYNPFLNLNSESHISMLCLFVLYGVFTGYSISFDYENIKEEYE
ncbi:YqhR family membrane protein [Pseudogracilibacillus sp. SE30717A]|uniref:YqhR family membrane protein n=1 Tax=Pseudogracilibacillus sp. SE30717A TaxID=3098293 RepID=UPI00300DF3F4